MHADSNPLIRLFFTLVLLLTGYSLSTGHDTIPLILSLPDSKPMFENGPWISAGENNGKPGDAPEAISSNSFWGSSHLLPVQTIHPVLLEKPTQKDWFLWIIITGLAGIALSHHLFPLRTRQLLKATLGGSHFSQMEREGGLFDETPFWLLFVNFLLIFSLLVYLSFEQMEPKGIPDSFSEILVFLVILGLMSAYYILKRIMTSFLAWVFHTYETNDAYIKNQFLFNNLEGILILPPVVYLAYTPGRNGLFIVWGLFVFINIIKVLRGAHIGLRQPGFSLYYLILYLCAIELAPLLIMAKAAHNVLIAQ